MEIVEQTGSHESAVERRSGRWGDLWLALGVFVVALSVYTQANHHAFHHHPDEPGKVKQVISKEWNFHHPMMMVLAAERWVKLAREAWGFERNAQSVVEVGRTVVAWFSAMAVVFLALWTRRRFGYGPALAVAAALVCSPEMFHLAHWFKEDPGLLMGFAGGLLAMRLLVERPGAGTAALAGAAAGVSISSKYIGVIASLLLLAGVVAVFFRGGGAVREARWRVLAVFVGVFGVVVVLLNYPLFLDIGGFLEGIGRELRLVREGHHGVREVEGPHAVYLHYLLIDQPAWLWPMALLFFIRGRGRRSRWALDDCYLVILLVFYLAAISMSPKIIFRYVYPVSILLLFMGVVGVAGCLRDLLLQSHRFGRILPRALPGALVVSLCLSMLFTIRGPVGGLLPLIEAYRLDTHARLQDWIARNLPPDAVIYQPDRYHLPDTGYSLFEGVPRGFSQKVLSERALFDQGSLEPLRKMGVTHVLIMKGRESRYLRENVEGEAEVLERMDRRARSFLALIEEGRLVYEVPRGPLYSLHDPLQLYEIR